MGVFVALVQMRSRNTSLDTAQLYQHRLDHTLHDVIRNEHVETD
jgi:hypothetical protein